MKRRTVNTIIYDNDKEYDGHMEIVAKSVKDNMGEYTEYTMDVGNDSLALTEREFQELRDLMDEVMNDDRA
jgi:hypothetical protein